MGDMNGKLIPVHIKKIRWHQSSWKISSIYAQIEVTAQSIVHAVRTACIAQSCAHIIAIEIPYSTVCLQRNLLPRYKAESFPYLIVAYIHLESVERGALFSVTLNT